MTFINGITILLVYQLIGEVLVKSLGISMPGPLVGMLLLFASLLIRRGVPTSVQLSANSLLSHFSLLFIPAGVGVIAHVNHIEKEWLPISVALLIGTLVALAATAAIMLISCKLLAKNGQKNA